MIRIRIDDVMWNSSGWDRERAIRRYRNRCNWLKKDRDNISHVAAIIVKDIQEYPETIELVKSGLNEGSLSPQLHCWEHVNYDDLTEFTITEHLEQSLDWFSKTLNFQPTIWITPWGSSGTPIMHTIAARFQLEIESTRFCIEPPHAVKLCIEHGNTNILHNQTVMDHWWKRGNHIPRIVEISRHGSYAAALEYDKENRKEKERIFT